jgi:hypothetical protein
MLCVIGRLWTIMDNQTVKKRAPDRGSEIMRPLMSMVNQTGEHTGPQFLALVPRTSLWKRRPQSGYEGPQTGFRSS